MQNGLQAHKSRIQEKNQRESDGSAVLLLLNLCFIKHLLKRRCYLWDTNPSRFKSLQKELCSAPCLYSGNFLWASLSLGSGFSMQAWDEETSSFTRSDLFFNENIHLRFITPETFHQRLNRKFIWKTKTEMRSMNQRWSMLHKLYNHLSSS